MLNKLEKFEIVLIDKLNELDKQQEYIDRSLVINKNNTVKQRKHKSYNLERCKVNLDMEFVYNHFEV
jgi:hypothetical protein